MSNIINSDSKNRILNAVLSQANVLKAKASGNPYWMVKSAVKDILGKDRDILVFLNPLWAQAEADAVASQTRNTKPKFTMLVDNYDRPVDSYNGTGGIWERGGKLEGSFTFNEYIGKVTITPETIEEVCDIICEETGEVLGSTAESVKVFNLTMAPIETITVDDLFAV